MQIQMQMKLIFIVWENGAKSKPIIIKPWLDFGNQTSW